MDALGRRCLKCQPSSRTGENPPYGMIGGTVETSASFEARYAPLSYPTAGGDQRWSSLPRQLPETAFEVGKLLNGACSCRTVDCRKNVVLIVINRGKMRTKGE